ncbi:MAG: sulfotransferase family 2 domain-containing protein [Sulfitobacter sp.]
MSAWKDSMATHINLPAPGLDISHPKLRHILCAQSLKVLSMRLRFCLHPELNPIRLFAPSKTIFVRVPKNASSSIVSMLYPVPGANKLPHFSAEFYRRVFPSQFRDWLVFAPLRNPLDRLASAFTYYREKTTIPQERQLMDEDLPFLRTFSDFVHWLNDQEDISAPRIMQWHHFRRQSDFVSDARGALITNLLFPVEDMSDGIARLQKHANITGAVPRLNVTRPLDLSGLPLARVTAHYAGDIALWERCMDEKSIETA